jgi:general secretion pathway protein A
VLHRVSGGSPRIINTLCDNALFEAYLAGATTVDAPSIEEIAKNLAFGAPEAPVGNGTPAPAGNVDLSEVDRYLESLKS